MTAAAQTSAIDLREWLRDPEMRLDLLELARAGLEHRRTELGRPLAADEFALIDWPEINPQELRVFERDGGLRIEDTAGRELATFV